jgi:uncharacterized protein with FMN-binding domain
MRRPAAAVVGLFLGAVLLIGAKVGTRAPMDLGAVSDTPDEPVPGAPGTPSAAASPDPSGKPSGSPSARRGSTRPAESSRPDPDSGSADDGMRSGTFAGGTVQYKYGTLQITIVVSGGRITDVRANHHGTSRMSEEINADALPKLRKEALAAQSARIDTVSGATYTSQTYRTSLQSAIDRAGG